MRLGFLSGSVDDIEKAGRLGFDAIELQAAAFGGVPNQPADPDAIDEARKRSQRHGVDVTAVAYYGLAGSSSSPSDALAAYQRVFDLTERLGVRTVANMGGFDAGRDWDTELLPERRYLAGVNGTSFRFRIPGYGEIDWAGFVSALVEIGYDGGVAIEHEDPIFWNERFDEGLQRGWQTLHPLIHPGR